MIQVRNLRYRYKNGNEITFPDMDIARGEQILLLGESGTGKTTLLHLMGGLLQAQQGSIMVQQTNLSELSESQLDHFRGKNIGFIFQKNHLIPALDVRKNLLLSPYLAGVSFEDKEIRHVAEKLGLESKLHSPVTELSQGQAQRVAIARAVMNKPSVIFADEPTSSLDDKNCHRVVRLLRDVADENKTTLVIATHDFRLKEMFKNHITLSDHSHQ